MKIRKEKGFPSMFSLSTDTVETAINFSFISLAPQEMIFKVSGTLKFR